MESECTQNLSSGIEENNAGTLPSESTDDVPALAEHAEVSEPHQATSSTSMAYNSGKTAMEQEGEEIECSEDETKSTCSETPSAAGGLTYSTKYPQQVTLHQLVREDIIQAGNAVLNINYKGTKFSADLLSDGRIRNVEDQVVFATPSAWAIHCKNEIEPGKKSGCGWASIKYKGKRLDSFKAALYRKLNPSPMKPTAFQQQSPYGAPDLSSPPHAAPTTSVSVAAAGLSCVVTGRPPAPTLIGVGAGGTSGVRQPLASSTKGGSGSGQSSGSNTVHVAAAKAKHWRQVITAEHHGPHRKPVRHEIIVNSRSPSLDTALLVQTQTFPELSTIQPFTISISSSCLLLVDFHSHMTSSEVVGYLGGIWDRAKHHVTVTQAFPARCALGDTEQGGLVEQEIQQYMAVQGLTLCGWYHSHPHCRPMPSLRDIDCQMTYQMKLKGSGAEFFPCVGLICSPYDKEATCRESEINAFWVVLPPENKLQQYGKPMSLIYSTIQDENVSPELLNDLCWCYDFYQALPDAIDFQSSLGQQQGVTYFNKIMRSLKKKYPHDESYGSMTLTQLLTKMLLM